MLLLGVKRTWAVIAVKFKSSCAEPALLFDLDYSLFRCYHKSQWWNRSGSLTRPLPSLCPMVLLRLRSQLGLLGLGASHGKVHSRPAIHLHHTEEGMIMKFTPTENE